MSSNHYSFKENKLSFISIFCSEKVNAIAEFQYIQFKESLEKYLESIVNDSLNDIKKFYKININESKEFISKIMISHFKSNLKTNGLLDTIYSLFFLIISFSKNANNKQHESITLSIVIISNLLIFFGFYLKWDSLFENSYIGFWSEILSLSYQENDNEIIKNKLANHFLNHTKIYFMEPIFFDNNKDNLNINEDNIFINIIHSQKEIDIKQINDLYENKLKKVDRTLISICNNI